jgi:hypothetical protein
VLFREVLYRLCRNEQGRLGYHLRVIKPTTWLDPDDCDDSDDWISISTPSLPAMAMRCGSTMGRFDPLSTAYDPNKTFRDHSL